MDKLGIQLPLLLAQIANFGILVFLLSKFLYKPVIKKLEERRAKIAAGLALTDSLKVKEEDLAKKSAQVLKDAKAEAQKIIAAAKKAGVAAKAEQISKGQVEITQERAKLHQELESELTQTKKALAGQTVEIASSMAAKIVSAVLSESQQHELIAQAITKLEKTS